jgi:DNA ligase-associated metallophosphoesterase
MGMLKPERIGLDDFADQHVSICGKSFLAHKSGALYWPAERALIVADLHLEKGSAFAARGQMLPPYDTRETLAKLAAMIDRYDPETVISLGDSLHDPDGAARMDANDIESLHMLQEDRDWIWITGNHDPELPREIGGTVAADVAIGPIVFRHEPTGAAGEVAGHLHPKARVSTRGRSVERRCFASDGVRAVMPAFGAYTGGLSIRDTAFAAIFRTLAFTAHVLGDRRVHMIAAARCY